METPLGQCFFYLQVRHDQPDGRGTGEEAEAVRVVGARRGQAVVQGRADLQGSGHLRLHPQEALRLVLHSLRNLQFTGFGEITFGK